VALWLLRGMYGLHVDARCCWLLLCLSDFGGDGSSLSQRGLPLMRADPPDACSPLAPGAYQNAILLTKRGNCFFKEKMTNGAAAGAAAVIILNNL